MFLVLIPSTLLLFETYQEMENLPRKWRLFLPPSYFVRGRVMFILENVCLSTFRGDTPIWLMGGTLFLPDEGRVPHPSQWGGSPILPHQGTTPRSGQGVLHSMSGWRLWGITPIPAQDRGYPRVPPSRSGPRSGQGLPTTGTAQHVLATRQAVCLLRSRRRTFLSLINLLFSTGVFEN